MDRRRLLSLLALAGSTTSLRALGPLAREPSLAPDDSTSLIEANAAPGSRARQSPHAILLGTAQDAGVPQINCFKDHCARVRAGDAPPPRVASLGIVDGDRRWLIDATPDLPAQVGMLLAPRQAPDSSVAGRTVPLHEHLHGILLTHAHMGHYTGLAQLGKEAAAPQGIPVWCTAHMAAYLRANAPWEALVRSGHIELREVAPGESVQLSARIRVEPFAVVHRQEYSDTVGYIVHGPDARLLYVPDADVWDGWPEPFESLLDRVDTALLDGSFYSLEELGHRVQGDVPHPPVSTTVARLRGRTRNPGIWFVHLNHTNPLWDPDSPLHAELPGGFAVASTGQRFAL